MTGGSWLGFGKCVGVDSEQLVCVECGLREASRIWTLTARLGLPMLSSPLPPILLCRTSMQEAHPDPDNSNDAGEGQPQSQTFIGFKKLPNFSREFLGSPSEGKRVRYLEIPRTDRMRSLPLPIALNDTGRLDYREISDTRRKHEKLRAFAGQCSKATDYLYFGGGAVAEDLSILKSKKITHVINCVRLELDNFFPNDLIYRGLYLQDSGGEDILCVLYDAFDFIEDAIANRGRVFVHCSQGVSRSAALVIAYVMWKTRRSYDVVKDEMKLRFWETRLREKPKCTIFRIGPQSKNAPCYMVPKLCALPTKLIDSNKRSDALDPRGVFVLILPGKAILWVGCKSPSYFEEGGRRFMAQLRKYEGIVMKDIMQGCETSEMLEAMGLNEGMDPSTYIAERDEFTSDYDLARIGMSARATPDTTRSNAFCSHLKS